MGFERFQMDSIFSLGSIAVALSSLVPRGTADTSDAVTSATTAAAPSATTAAAAVAGGAYTNGEIEQLLGQLNWDSELVSMEDIQGARANAEEAYETLCRCAHLYSFASLAAALLC